MIVSLEIDKIESGCYRAAVLHGNVEACVPSLHSSIEQAIHEEASAVPEGFAHFIEPRYQGFSAGTVTLAQARDRASELADRLVALVALAHELSHS